MAILFVVAVNANFKKSNGAMIFFSMQVKCYQYHTNL